MPFMKDLIRLLEARGIRQKYVVLVGGASVNADCARSRAGEGQYAKVFGLHRVGLM